jgi:ligand-binding SRPBCC domain-containing protein
MKLYQFKDQLTINASLDEVWDFISSPSNLRLITPSQMAFEITSPDLPSKMHPGMIISYRVSPLPMMRTTWVTEITYVQEKSYFVDEQRFGPYSFWQHQHWLTPTEQGVVMTDIITYKIPFGVIGRLANWLFIGQQIQKIFAYRRQALGKIFV